MHSPLAIRRDTWRRDPWLMAALLLGAALLAVNVYRAATQSFTIDEAFSFHYFILPRLREALSHYDANNHILLTLLCRICLWAFGPSELSLRLPVLLGGAAYLLAIAATARKIAPDGILFLATYACLTLNPFILDFLSVSRGYGLALGFFALGLMFLTSRLVVAGICFGLCVAANLVFVIPVAAVIAACGVNHLIDRRSLWKALSRVVLPAVGVALLIDIVPLRTLRRDSFYYGADTVRQMLDSFVRECFQHHSWFGNSTAGAFAPTLEIAIVLLTTGLIAASFFAAKLPPAHRLVLFCFSFTVAAIPLFHFATGFRYPVGRTGIYLPVMLTLGVAAATGLSDARQFPMRGHSFLRWQVSASLVSGTPGYIANGPSIPEPGTRSKCWLPSRIPRWFA